MEQSGTRDMTQGSPIRLILAFFWPVLLGLLFQQLYVFVDTMIVGRYLGTTALAAVGASSSITLLTTGFISGTTSGFGIPISQSFGEHNIDHVRRYTIQSGMLTLLFLVVMTLGTTLGCGGILHLINTQSDIFQDAYAYLFILFVGIPARFLYNYLSAVIRSLGESRFLLVCMVTSSLVNIALDLFTVLVLGMGVAGAALATILSELLSAVMSLIYVRKYKFLRPKPGEMKIDRQAMRTLLGTGLPMGFQSSITMLGIVVMQSAVNRMGTIAIAALTASTKIVYLFDCPFNALGVTIATFAGQNLGANKVSRIRDGVRAALIAGVVYSALALVVIALAGRALVGLFVSEGGEEVIYYAWRINLWSAAFYVLCAGINVLRYALQGMGYSKIAIFAGFFEMIGRGTAGLFLIPALGYPGIYVAQPLAWVLAICFLAPLYLKIMGEKLGLVYRLPRPRLKRRA